MPHTEQMIEKLLALFEGDSVYIDPALGSQETESAHKIKPPTPIAQPAIQTTLQAVENELKVRRYSIHTRKTYLRHIRQFLNSLDKPPQDAPPEEIYAYFLKLVDQDRISYSYHNQTISGIRFLYTYVLEKPHLLSKIPRPRSEKKLPVILSREAVTRLLGTVDNIKSTAVSFSEHRLWCCGHSSIMPSSF